jgi:hypothetical protein
MSETKKTIKFGDMTLEMEEEKLTGRYSNLVMINHTPDDFIFDFAFVDPATRTAILLQRIILSPSHCKRFFQALKANLERYEQTFGVIPLPNLPPPIQGPTN